MSEKRVASLIGLGIGIFLVLVLLLATWVGRPRPGYVVTDDGRGRIECVDLSHWENQIQCKLPGGGTRTFYNQEWGRR